MGKDKLANKRYTLFRIVRIAIFASILFVQEELLSFLPNIQFTQALITIYYYSFGLMDTCIIVFIHVLLDNLVMGSISFLYTPAMIIGWESLVFILHFVKKLCVKKNVENNKYLISLIVGLHSYIYSWLFLIVGIIMYKYDFLPYLLSDLPFELILMACGIVTTFVLLNPLTKVLIKLENKYKRLDNQGYDNQIIDNK